MSDDDVASEREDLERERAIAAARAQVPAKPLPQPKLCIEGCGEPTLERSRFCSKDCMEMHSQRQAQHQRSGTGR